MYDSVMKVKFELESADGKITKEFEADDLESWMALMLQFGDFLSAQYGYGISDKIRFITDYPLGREKEYCISTEDWSWLEKHKERFQRQAEMFNDEDDSN